MPKWISKQNPQLFLLASGLLLSAFGLSVATGRPLKNHEPGEYKTKPASFHTSDSDHLALGRKKVIMQAKRTWAFAWSPDGTRIAIGEGRTIAIHKLDDPGEEWVLYRSPFGGPEAEGIWIGDISWSSKDIIAFSWCYDVDCTVELISLNGKQVAQVKGVGGPVWLPDGEHLMFATEAGLFLWDSDTKANKIMKWFLGHSYAVLDQQRIIYGLSSEPEQYSEGIFPPDASFLPGTPGLVLYNLNTEEWKQLTRGRRDHHPTVVAQQYVIFVRGEKGFGEEEHLWVYDLETGEEHKLHNEKCIQPAASPVDSALLCWTVSNSQLASTLFELE